MEEFIQNITGELGKSVPSLINAILILVIGWLLAVIAAWAVKGLLSRTDLDNRLASWVTGSSESRAVENIEKWISTAVFWVAMTFVAVAFLNALQLEAVSTPLQSFLNEILTALPQLIYAAVLLGVAWLLATLSRLLMVRGLQSFSLDDRLNASVSDEESGSAPPSILVSETLGDILYWLIFLLFLPAILDVLGLDGALAPIQSMVDQFLAFLPNIVGAIVIGVVGWFLARIIRLIVTKFLAAAGADRLGERFGLSQATGGQSLSALAGTIVYVLILIPAIISALQRLNVSAISDPAVEMLGQVLSALPKIFTAALILVVAYVVGKIVADLVANLLTGVGFDNVFSWLGLQATQTASGTPPASASSGTTSAGTVNPSATPGAATTLQTSELPQKTPSEIAGIVVLVGFILVALIPATDVLEFAPLTGVVTRLLAVLAQVLVGVFVFAVGLYFANLAFNLISSSGGGQARLVAQAARVAIIALVSAMALQQMGIATNIVNLAFGLMFGSVAIALAVAFGFGSMDVAGEQMHRWISDFQSRD
ncbi:MAG: mechanosensitive ion channel [Thermosynechococcaceae cyanobacterium]